MSANEHPNTASRMDRVRAPIKESPLGILEGVDGRVSDADAYGFYEAADAFAASKSYNLLKSTRYRQFRLQLDPIDDEVPSNTDSFDMFDVVELHGLTSAAGSKLNGLKGEVVPKIPSDPVQDKDTRWRVRLFEDGKCVSVRASCLTLVRKYDLSRDFIAKVSGADGHGYGVEVYRSWATLHQNMGQSECYGDAPPTTNKHDPACGTFSVTLEFFELELAMQTVPNEVALRRRLGFPNLPEFPVVYGKSSDRERTFTRLELKALEAGLRAAVQFIPKLVENPVPPLPYFTPFAFQPLQQDYVFVRGDGGGGPLTTSKKVPRRISVTTIRARCIYPDGNLLSLHHPWRSYHSLVMRFAPRPLSVLTIDQAISFHRSALEGITWEQIQADARVGNFLYLAHKCGLSHALWEAEQEEFVREGLEIGRKILDINHETDPKDEHCLRRYVMDVSLEVGEWDTATAVLSRYPDCVDEELVWLAVLIYFKSRGPDSKTTRKALVDAVLFNAAVYRLLIGETLVDEEAAERCRAMGTSYFEVNGRRFGVPQNAPNFYGLYSKHFFQDKDIIDWMKSKREALKPLLDAEPGQAGDFSIDKLDEAAMSDHFEAAAKGDIGVSLKNTSKNAAKLSKNDVCCARCGGIGNLSKCSRCHQVSYCNRECQVGHWKEHKAVCKKASQAKAERKVVTTQQEEIGHPSWAKLNADTRKNLLKYHKDGNWEPWPVTAEAPAMLNYPSYSFLTAHPAMTFRAVAEEPPHGFRMAYDDASDSNVHGKTFEAGQAPFLMLREKHSMAGPDNKVPLHDMGVPTDIVLVAEVRYTQTCKMAFQAHYNHDNKGKMFDWPGEEAIAVCPGTGKIVQPNSKEVRVLAAFNMHGFYTAGTAYSMLSRIIPRIVTLEGLERLMGSNPCVSYVGPGGRPGCEEMQPIYPDLLRRFAGQKPKKPPKKPPTADAAWDAFHASGRYCALDQYYKKGQEEMKVRMKNSLSRS